MMPNKCTVVRDGQEQKVDALELVPGDLVRLYIGDRVPADIRIIETYDLKASDGSTVQWCFTFLFLQLTVTRRHVCWQHDVWYLSQLLGAAVFATSFCCIDLEVAINTPACVLCNGVAGCCLRAAGLGCSAAGGVLQPDWRV
jgi:hypothetical protein